MIFRLIKYFEKKTLKGYIRFFNQVRGKLVLTYFDFFQDLFCQKLGHYLSGKTFGNIKSYNRIFFSEIFIFQTHFARFFPLEKSVRWPKKSNFSIGSEISLCEEIWPSEPKRLNSSDQISGSNQISFFPAHFKIKKTGSDARKK